MIDWLLQHKSIILFYLVIIIFLIIKRKDIVAQAKVILLYRTKWGLTWISAFSARYRQLVILAGYIGVGIGFAGMIFISLTLLKNLYDLIISPATTPGVSLVLPGVKVPGLGVLPFWYWLLAIFIIAVIHEFSHGIVAKAHNIKVKNTGLVFFGPIIGAFVEPEEEKLLQEKDIVQYSVYAAGSFSNILLAVVALLLLSLVFAPLQQTMVQPSGFTFQGYYNSTFPAAKAGILPGMVITTVNNVPITEFQTFSDELQCAKPGEIISVGTAEKTYSIILAQSPDNAKQGFLGITEIENKVEIKEKYQHGIWNVIYSSVDWITGFLRWLYILSFGIALFNLLPLPIVDGGRMAQTFLRQWKGQEKGDKRYKQIGLFFLLILLLSLFFPLISKLF